MNKSRRELIDLILQHAENPYSLKGLAYLETIELEGLYCKLYNII